MKNKEESNVRLIKPKGGGYFLEVKDKYTTNRLAISEYELLLIFEVIKDEVVKIYEKR